MFNNRHLALACLDGRLHSVKFLVDVVNLAVNDKHGYEQTAVHKAALKSHTDVCFCQGKQILTAKISNWKQPCMFPDNPILLHVQNFLFRREQISTSETNITNCQKNLQENIYGTVKFARVFAGGAVWSV